MKKTGLYIALVCAIPLGMLAGKYHMLGPFLIIGALLGWAAAIYDMRDYRG